LDLFGYNKNQQSPPLWRWASPAATPDDNEKSTV